MAKYKVFHTIRDIHVFNSIQDARRYVVELLWKNKDGLPWVIYDENATKIVGDVRLYDKRIPLWSEKPGMYRFINMDGSLADADYIIFDMLSLKRPYYSFEKASSIDGLRKGLCRYATFGWGTVYKASSDGTIKEIGAYKRIPGPERQLVWIQAGKGKQYLIDPATGKLKG